MSLRTYLQFNGVIPPRLCRKEVYMIKQADLIGNNRFLVVIGNTKLSFAKVSNLESSIDTDTIQIGGINNFVHVVTSPKKQQQTITFERGIMTGTNILDKIRPGVRLGTSIEIMVLRAEDKRTNKIVKKFYIDDGLVTKWETSTLDALSNEVLIQKFEIAHTGLYIDY